LIEAVSHPKLCLLKPEKRLARESDSAFRSPN
jgi:hypothetical protein